MPENMYVCTSDYGLVLKQRLTFFHPLAFAFGLELACAATASLQRTLEAILFSLLFLAFKASGKISSSGRIMAPFGVRLC